MAKSIKEQMEENSKLWHTADATTRKQLEATNQKLGSQLGASYDSKAGTWADKSGSSLYGGAAKAPSGGGSTDYSVMLKDLLGKNAGNFNDDVVGQVQNLFDQRNSKINSDPSLYKYANDDIMMAAQNYLSGAKSYKQQQDMLTEMQGLMQQQYESPYQQDIAGLLSGLTNRKDFSYDHTKDPAWQAYATQFGILGDQAMADTLGDVSGMTGGLPSSYAVTAAAQAKNNYNSKMTDIIPTLMDAAYSRYQAGVDTDMGVAGLMSNIDANMYSQFSDTKGQTMDAARWMAEYGYNASRDQKADQQYDKEFDYMVGRDKVMDEQWMKQYTAEEQQRMISNAMDSRQISVSEGNLALSRLKYNDDKNETEEDTSYYGEMYQEMVSSDDPEKWLAQNASILTKEELEWLKKQMPGASGETSLFD